jgi:GDP-mannose 4,6 dehydratase
MPRPARGSSRRCRTPELPDRRSPIGLDGFRVLDRGPGRRRPAGAKFPELVRNTGTGTGCWVRGHDQSAGGCEMTVLVTGGAGFIGAEVVRTLVARGGEDVHVTTHSGNLQRLASVTDQVTMHRLDLADGPQVSALVAAVRPRAIYHLGAMLSGPSEADPQTAIQTNAFGTYALLEAPARARAMCD